MAALNAQNYSRSVYKWSSGKATLRHKCIKELYTRLYGCAEPSSATQVPIASIATHLLVARLSETRNPSIAINGSSDVRSTALASKFTPQGTATATLLSSTAKQITGGKGTKDVCADANAAASMGGTNTALNNDTSTTANAPSDDNTSSSNDGKRPLWQRLHNLPALNEYRNSGRFRSARDSSLLAYARSLLSDVLQR